MHDMKIFMHVLYLLVKEKAVNLNKAYTGIIYQQPLKMLSFPNCKNKLKCYLLHSLITESNFYQIPLSLLRFLHALTLSHCLIVIADIIFPL